MRTSRDHPAAMLFILSRRPDVTTGLIDESDPRIAATRRIHIPDSAARLNSIGHENLATAKGLMGIYRTVFVEASGYLDECRLVILVHAILEGVDLLKHQAMHIIDRRR